MDLNENSKNLLIILQRDPEKLKVFNSLKSEQEVYEYAVSLIPNYTREEFEEFKRVLSSENEMELISEDEISQVSGGSIKNVAKVLQEYQDGVKIATETLGPVAGFLAGLFKKKNK